MDAIQINIQANEEQQEILISQLEELDANGFEQTENTLLAYFPESTFRKIEIEEILKEYQFSIATIKDQNWNEVWERNFQPVVIGNFCGVRADFHQPIRDTQHEIIITPKMSFGTGHHATTYMMIEQMSGIDFTDKAVFDFGTGTGILAILAEKMGAATITAIDVDEWSIENARENIERNGCTRINLGLSTEIPTGQFDIILANINRNVILQYLTNIESRLKPNGLLLLSGLLATDEKYIVNMCNMIGLECSKCIERNNWISILLNRK